MTVRTEPQPAVDVAPHHAGAATLLDLLLARIDDAADRPALATLPRADTGATTWTWLEVAAAAVDLAERFEATGLRRGDRVVHVGTHSVDWVVVDLACLLAGVVHAALHVDGARDELLRQIAWLAPAGIVTSGEEGAFPPASAALLRGAVSRGRAFDLRMPEPRRTMPWSPPGAGLRSVAWQSLAADPARVRREVARRTAAADPDGAATIFLSSGTTGRPRGYVHSQRSLVTNALSAAAIFLDEPDDVRLSWLPMSHALACTGDLSTALVRGGCLNVVPDRRRLLEACRFLPPSVILGVPAFYERLERGVRSGTIPDLAAALGGRVRVCVSGGAPLRERTQSLFASRGVPLVEGYGLAEAGPVVALESPRGHRPGWVGRPLTGIDVRLDDRGQLLVRTPSRAIALIPQPDAPGDAGGGGPATLEAPEGWIATGDTAEIAVDGQIRITGRVVDTLVLSTGAKVPPAEVERVLADDPVVAQVCVCGDRLPAPVALIVPEPGVLRAAIRSLGVVVASRRAALRHPRVLRWLAQRIARRQEALPAAWQVRRIVLVNRPFDIDRGEMTHSMKLKRPTIANHFSATLDAASAPSPPPGVAVVRPGGDRPDPRATAGISAALWGRPGGDDGGFAAAAAIASSPLPDSISAVLEQAEARLTALRAEGRLHAPTPASGLPPAPLADAPPPPDGMFTPAAEEAMRDVGLWGILVPAAHGGCGGTVVDLVRSVTRIAGVAPTAAGMLAVHSSIGAVSALAAFGTPDQQARHLPSLAIGRPLSVFGATEPEVGCDLGAVRTTLTRRGDRLVVDGTKMFITNAAHGRLVKLLALADGKPAVALVRLPDHDTAEFRLLSYALHPLRHTPNHALEFRGLAIDERDLLVAPGGDAMAVVWHGLNRGRCTLAAQAAGTLRLLGAHAREHALRRSTWGQPIASRQLVQGRLARIAAGRMACEALSTWAAATIDGSGGGGGELEAITAKVVASQAVRDGAIDALGIHGGRAFLVGHPLGDSFHDHLAVGVYEGESDLLGLALFKGLSRRHPLAERLRHGGRFAAALGWLGWRVARLAAAAATHDRGILDRRLRDHAAAARTVLSRTAVAIDRGVRRHGRALAERQLEVGALAAVVRDAAGVLAIAHHADARGDDAAVVTADVWCRIALSRATGRQLTPADHAAIGALGRAIADGMA